MSRELGPVRWIGATTLGAAVGVTVSTVLAGTPGRSLSTVAGGALVVLGFGAIIGLVLGASQVLALPRGVLPWHMWTLATLVGAAFGFGAAAAVGELLGNVIDPTISVAVGGAAIQITSGAAVGLGVGGAQSFVLRRSLVGAGGWWILSTVVGAGLGYGAAIGVLELFDVPILKANVILSFGAILGLFIGVAQGLVLWSRGRRLAPAPS